MQNMCGAALQNGELRFAQGAQCEQGQRVLTATRAGEIALKQNLIQAFGGGAHGRGERAGRFVKRGRGAAGQLHIFGAGEGRVAVEQKRDN